MSRTPHDASPPLTPFELRAKLKALLSRSVVGMSWDDKLRTAQTYLGELGRRQDPQMASVAVEPTIEILPFSPGARPVDEALRAGTGCSERDALLSTADEAHDELLLLYQLSGIDAGLMAAIHQKSEPEFRVTMSSWLLGDDEPVPVATDDPVALCTLAAEYPAMKLVPARFEAFFKTRYVAVFDPRRVLEPPAGGDALGFASMFTRPVRIELSLWHRDRVLSRASTVIDVYHLDRFGSLYARLLDDLVKIDTEAQRKRLALPALDPGFHPFFPVLAIGMRKADLYMRAIIDDLKLNRRNLPDPAWLLKVGLYLELLTCLGLFEAVRDEHPTLLTAAEREALERSPGYAKIRQHLDVPAWRRVWKLHEVVPAGHGVLSAGPVSLLNMLRKEEATLAFLHAHHEDLKHAIELAGPNPTGAQETWHRVFRDAERAVLYENAAAFPEILYLDARLRQLVLWHQAGDFNLPGPLKLSRALTSTFGDKDAIVPAACRQYRASMNDVARWARDRKLLDYTGDECVPLAASLLEAHMAGDQAAVTALQRRDGYAATLEIDHRVEQTVEVSPRDIERRLRRVRLFDPLTDREIARLAEGTHARWFGPMDRVVIQGQTGASLYVVDAGSVDVLIRDAGGHDQSVATLGPGAVFGEGALLTGAPRGATVRALGAVILYEIDKEAMAPIIEGRPGVVVELSLLMAQRQHSAEPSATAVQGLATGLASRITSFLLG